MIEGSSYLFDIMGLERTLWLGFEIVARRCVMKSNFGKNFSKKDMYKTGRLVRLVLLTQ